MASSDFTHYESKDNVERKDSLLIDVIKTLDLDKFYRVLQQYNITACGYGAIATIMKVTKELDDKIELVNHMTLVT